ncbi:MAG: cupin domain-containing protein [Candidatus Limivicinus sp.]|jgi:mannose-6-phosphate isomerase-like protein (cupin superfamily)
MSFVRTENDVEVSKKKMFGGDGEAEMHRLLSGDGEMYGKGRVFNHLILAPGSEIGWHVHKGDGETYYILKGRGEYNDNGKVVTVKPGDVTFVGDGEGHSLKCIGDEPLEAIALILYM